KEVIVREAVPTSQAKPTSQEQFGPQIIRNISIDDDPMKGNPDASINIIEFSDFQCPFCAKFHETTLPQLEENYISTGKVNFVYRDFPIQSIHPNAIPAALASECADDQGKFWEMHDEIFKNQRIWQDLEILQSVALFKQYASNLGLDENAFDSCLDSGKYLDEITNDLNDGRAYGVTGTPGFFVGNEEIGFTKIIGAQPFSAFQRVIDEQLDG
ncbi:disulfide bond formation protein DsbA, partial [Nitrosopumilus sp. b3]|uniref:DsbA family protein n=1 Tax=Nitrosopumilus sp. b3 TaxID=2109909 RepID=UPI0015F5910A